MWSDWLVFFDCGFQSVCLLMEKDKRLMEATRWERLTEEETGSQKKYTKKIFTIQIITIVWEPDILEYEGKWALESIATNKASGGDGIPVPGISNPERWCYESAALNMPANLENSTVATGLEKLSFHSIPKERQCQKMLKLLHNCTHLTR